MTFQQVFTVFVARGARSSGIDGFSSNIFETCFHPTLRALLSLSPFYNWLHSMKNTCTQLPVTRTILAISEWMRTMDTSDTIDIPDPELQEICRRYAAYSQDAYKFVNCLMESMEKEFRKQFDPSEVYDESLPSPQSIFGTFLECSKCSSCKRWTTEEKAFKSITLSPTDASLELDNFFATKSIVQTCTLCGKTVDAERKISLINPPAVLCIRAEPIKPVNARMPQIVDLGRHSYNHFNTNALQYELVSAVVNSADNLTRVFLSDGENGSESYLHNDYSCTAFYKLKNNDMDNSNQPTQQPNTSMALDRSDDEPMIVGSSTPKLVRKMDREDDCHCPTKVHTRCCTFGNSKKLESDGEPPYQTFCIFPTTTLPEILRKIIEDGRNMTNVSVYPSGYPNQSFVDNVIELIARHCKGLQSITVHECKLEKRNQFCFKKLNWLKEIIIKSTIDDIVMLQSIAANCRQLEKLELTINGSLKTAKSAIGRLHNLRHLKIHCGKQDMTALVQELNSLRSLNVLELCDAKGHQNCVEKILQLTQLRFLRLTNFFCRNCKDLDPFHRSPSTKLSFSVSGSLYKVECVWQR